MQTRESQTVRPDCPRTLLLERLLSNPRMGAFLKGLGVFIKDYETGTTIPNTFWRELGYNAGEMRGHRWKRFVHPEDRQLVDEFSARLCSGAADAWEGEYRIKAASGEYRRVRHKALVLERNSAGLPTLYVGLDADISEDAAKLEAERTERELHERRFMRSETIRTAGAILSSALDPVRAAARVLAQAARVFAYDAAAVWTLDGNKLSLLAARGEPDAFRGGFRSECGLGAVLQLGAPRVTRRDAERLSSILEIPLIVRGAVHGLLEFRSSREDSFGREEIGSAVQFGDHAVVALSNALRYRAAEIEAATDWLTGLPTRRSFMSRAARLIDDLDMEEPLSAVMVDIDRFKRVNDDFGHAAGDAALSVVAKTCRDALRSHDLICRYGGEEILALLPGADGETAYAIAERLRKRVESIKLNPHPDMRLTVSVGIHTGTGAMDFRELVQRADEALYMAKAAGRNRCEVR